MKVYTVGEFRKNTKEALDSVVAGEEVTLVRGTDIFMVMKARIEVQGTPVYRGTPIENTPLPEKPKVQNPEKIKSEATPPSDSVADLFTVPPVAEVLEQECCLNEQRPCKHWSWDIQSGDGYVNTLSGRKLEVE